MSRLDRTRRFLYASVKDAEHDVDWCNEELQTARKYEPDSVLHWSVQLGQAEYRLNKMMDIVEEFDSVYEECECNG